MAKLLQPIFVLKDTSEDTLVIAVQDEGDQTAYRDTHLEALASPKPGSHCEKTEEMNKRCRHKLKYSKRWAEWL
jgi:hypothetical protein